MVEKTNQNTSFVINETKKASSYEHGSTGNRHKLYYENPEDLDAQIKKLIELGYWDK